MRIVLCYPPPWKLAQLEPDRDGPPDGYREGDLDPDFHQIPYGLLSLGAQAIRAGHQVKVLNLSSYPWSRVEEVVRTLEADVWAMSAWTANRRGVALLAAELDRQQPRAHVVVGGPHATPLAREILAHVPAIDTVCTGESEATFVELLARLEAGRPLAGLAGAWVRGPGGSIEQGPARANLRDLDELADPHDYFDTHIVMTSRGCPWQCTFCGADTTWGRGFRGQSLPRVLDTLEKTALRLPVKMLQIKDDTFTANKKRALDIARGIRGRGLNFLWSCDTRVDVLTEELLREMRLAGCERLSLGVESGSAAVLAAIQKKITKDEILAAATMAKAYGIKLRFYMMLGNRGETAETFRETLAFLEEARPHQYLFSCLSVYPGTVDFHDAERAGWLDREVFFTETFQEYKVPFDASPADAELMSAWWEAHKGLQPMYEENVDACEAVLGRIPEHHAAWLDLAGAAYRAGDLGVAERAAKRALELRHPCPGLALNYLACLAVRRREYDRMMELYSEAARADPQHPVLIRNVQTAKTWFAKGGPAKGIPLELVARHDFQLLERTVQPTLPGPLPDDYAAWAPEAVVRAKPVPERLRRHLPLER